MGSHRFLGAVVLGPSLPYRPYTFSEPASSHAGTNGKRNHNRRCGLNETAPWQVLTFGFDDMRSLPKVWGCRSELVSRSRMIRTVVLGALDDPNTLLHAASSRPGEKGFRADHHRRCRRDQGNASTPTLAHRGADCALPVCLARKVAGVSTPFGGASDGRALAVINTSNNSIRSDGDG